MASSICLKQPFFFIFKLFIFSKFQVILLYSFYHPPSPLTPVPNSSPFPSLLTSYSTHISTYLLVFLKSIHFSQSLANFLFCPPPYYIDSPYCVYVLGARFPTRPRGSSGCRGGAAPPHQDPASPPAPLAV